MKHFLPNGPRDGRNGSPPEWRVSGATGSGGSSSAAPSALRAIPAFRRLTASTSFSHSGEGPGSSSPRFAARTEGRTRNGQSRLAVRRFLRRWRFKARLTHAGHPAMRYLFHSTAQSRKTHPVTCRTLTPPQARPQQGQRSALSLRGSGCSSKVVFSRSVDLVSHKIARASGFCKPERVRRRRDTHILLSGRRPGRARERPQRTGVRSSRAEADSDND